MCRCPSLSRYSALPSLRSRLPALVLKFTSKGDRIGAKHTAADELLFDDEFDDKQLDLASGIAATPGAMRPRRLLRSALRSGVDVEI